jgi:hypothetical protein
VEERERENNRKALLRWTQDLLCHLDSKHFQRKEKRITSMFCNIFVAGVPEILIRGTVLRNLLSGVFLKLTYTLPFMLYRFYCVVRCSGHWHSNHCRMTAV